MSVSPGQESSPRGLSIVIPAHQEAAALPALFARLSPVLDRLEDRTEGPRLWTEVLLVDDGSRDDSWAVIGALHARDSRVKGVRLLRRFGHQNALLAGLSKARGEGVVILDADLQDPPEVIETLVSRWLAGAQVVHGVRRSRRPDTFFKRNSARAFRWAISLLAGTALSDDVGDFVLLDRQVVGFLIARPGGRPFLRGEVAWAGFSHAAVDYDRGARVAGATKYPLSRMMGLALDGITGLTFLPLRLLALGGLVCLVAGVALALVPESSKASLLVLTGVNLLGLGLVGEYVGRIHERLQGRPNYLVAESLGLAPAACDPQCGTPSLRSRETGQGRES